MYELACIIDYESCFLFQLEIFPYRTKNLFSSIFYHVLHVLTVSCMLVCHVVFSVQTLEGCEILLGPEVTYGPPGLDLFCPVAMTIAHCAEVDAENWSIQLKRKTQDSKWEVSRGPPPSPVMCMYSSPHVSQAHTRRVAHFGSLLPFKLNVSSNGGLVAREPDGCDSSCFICSMFYYPPPVLSQSEAVTASTVLHHMFCQVVGLDAFYLLW